MPLAVLAMLLGNGRMKVGTILLAICMSTVAAGSAEAQQSIRMYVVPPDQPANRPTTSCATSGRRRDCDNREATGPRLAPACRPAAVSPIASIPEIERSSAQ
jgi:hypothetical protein